MPDENGNGTQIIEGGNVIIEDIQERQEEIEVKNPRIGRVLKLQEEAEQQNVLERQRGRRIRQQQMYVDRMIASVEENLKNTKEEQAYNEAFERQIRTQVYRMHGISEDKLTGMTEARRSWQQGAAFALFFLSLMMIVLCGMLHGFGSEICIFMAFFTAIEGTLLSNGKKQRPLLDGVIKVLYLLLYPAMMVIFVCYELGFEEYGKLLPYFTARKERRKRWKERWTAIRKREKDDVQPYSVAEDAEESPVKTEPPEVPDKPTPQESQSETAPAQSPEETPPREAQPSGTELDSPSGIG